VNKNEKKKTKNLLYWDYHIQLEFVIFMTSSYLMK